MHDVKSSVFWVTCGTLLAALAHADGLWAQTFTSGSTGALGAFTPTTNTTVMLPPDGVLNYTTVSISSGVTVTFQRNVANTPVTLLATGEVTIAGTLSVDGIAGGNPATTAAPGGPGGFAGGLPGNLPSAGQGPGGATTFQTGAFGSVASYGAPLGLTSLLPFFGGSGGSGGFTGTFDHAGGGGGGGAIVLASSTSITVTGTINARGGAGAVGISGGFSGGNGSGGAIRLVAPHVTGSGTLSVLGGSSQFGVPTGGPGLIRIEAFTVGFTGTTSPAAFFSTAPGPVTGAGNPGLITLPTLRLTAVNNQATPTTPSGSFATPDLALPVGTTNPVPVTLTVTNTPFPTTFTVKVVPRSGTPSTVTASAVAGGSFATATYTANVTLPAGQVSILNAYGAFTLPPIAGLLPLIDGEEVDHVLVAAGYGEPSSLWLVSRSGRQIPVGQLSREDQLTVVSLFERMR